METQKETDMKIINLDSYRKSRGDENALIVLNSACMQAVEDILFELEIVWRREYEMNGGEVSAASLGNVVKTVGRNKALIWQIFFRRNADLLYSLSEMIADCTAPVIAGDTEKTQEILAERTQAYQKTHDAVVDHYIRFVGYVGGVKEKIGNRDKPVTWHELFEDYATEAKLRYCGAGSADDESIRDCVNEMLTHFLGSDVTPDEEVSSDADHVFYAAFADQFMSKRFKEE